MVFWFAFIISEIYFQDLKHKIVYGINTDSVE